MAITHDFLFQAQDAEFRNGLVITGSKALAVEARNCTLREADAYLATLSAQIPEPHMASFRMRYRDLRKPAGFSKAKRTIYREA